MTQAEREIELERARVRTRMFVAGATEVLRRSKAGTATQGDMDYIAQESKRVIRENKYTAELMKEKLDIQIHTDGDLKGDFVELMKG